jgi:spore germination protein (amino acid permease)
MISGFLVFFLIHSSQVGVGSLTFQRMVFKNAGQDAWISVILMGLSLHLIVHMIYKMLGNPAKDLTDLHRIIFGNILGNALSLLIVGFFILVALSVLRSYIEVIQVWVFPSLKTWELALLFICVIYYLVSGGFRVVAGFCFFGVLISTFAMILFYFPIKHGKLNNLLPMFNHSFQDLLKSAKASTGLFIGFETLLIYFPFIKTPEKTEKWSHYALLFSTLKYLALIVFALLYYSQGLLKQMVWPALGITKIMELSFLARFEYLFIFLWLIIYFPSVCLSIWSCTRITKKTTNLKPRLSLLLILSILFIAVINVKDRFMVDALGKFVSEVGFYFIFAYIPLIFILSWIQKSLRKNNV